MGPGGLLEERAQGEVHWPASPRVWGLGFRFGFEAFCGFGLGFRFGFEAFCGCQSVGGGCVIR